MGRGWVCVCVCVCVCGLSQLESFDIGDVGCTVVLLVLEFLVSKAQKGMRRYAVRLCPTLGLIAAVVLIRLCFKAALLNSAAGSGS